MSEIGAFYNKKDLEEGLGLVQRYKKVLTDMYFLTANI